jgi:hypothetical protein
VRSLEHHEMSKPNSSSVIKLQPPYTLDSRGPLPSHLNLILLPMTRGISIPEPLNPTNNPILTPPTGDYFNAFSLFQEDFVKSDPLPRLHISHSVVEGSEASFHLHLSMHAATLEYLIVKLSSFYAWFKCSFRSARTIGHAYLKSILQLKPTRQYTDCIHAIHEMSILIYDYATLMEVKCIKHDHKKHPDDLC